MVLGFLLGCGTQETSAPSFERAILVTIDTLRADHLGFLGYPRETSPFLDGLAERSIIFENAIAGSSHTAPSHATMLTGQLPLQHRLLENGQVLPPGPATLAETLAAQGFETAAFVSVGFLDGLSRGFQTFDSSPLRQSRKLYGANSRPAEHTLSAALDWQKARTETPTFLWVHLFDVHEHSSEAMPPNFEDLRAVRESAPEGVFRPWLLRTHGLLEDALDLDLMDRYDAQILRTDRELSRFYEALSRGKAARRTLWMFTADHGEGLGSHGLRGHGRHLYQEQLRAFLLVHGTEQDWPSRRIEATVSHADITPTVLDLLGLQQEDHRRDQQKLADRLAGRSLVQALQGGEVPRTYAYSQRRRQNDKTRRQGWLPGEVLALQTQDFKYIFKTEGEDEFYLLGEDPTEASNRIHEEHPEKSRLEQTLRALLAEAGSELEGDSMGAADPAFAEELKALGYL